MRADSQWLGHSALTGGGGRAALLISRCCTPEGNPNAGIYFTKPRSLQGAMPVLITHRRPGCTTARRSGQTRGLSCLKKFRKVNRPCRLDGNHHQQSPNNGRHVGALRWTRASDVCGPAQRREMKKESVNIPKNIFKKPKSSTPMMTAPASSNRCTGSLFASGTRSRFFGLPSVDGRPATSLFSCPPRNEKQVQGGQKKRQFRPGGYSDDQHPDFPEPKACCAD